MSRKSILSSASLLMVVIVFSKLLGMARDVVLANYFGTSAVSDAYLIAVSVPTLLFYFIGHSLSTAFLPMYNKVKQEQGAEAADRYMNNLTGISLLCCTVIVVVLIAAPEIVVRIFAAGFDQETTDIASSFIRISACSLYFMAIVNIWGGYLQAGQNYLIPAMISVPRNVVIMISVVLAAKIHVLYLGIGLLAAYVAEFLLLLPYVLRRGLRFRWCVDWKDESVKQTLCLVFPVLLGMSVSQINKIVDRSLASMATEGGISALSYASNLNNAIQEVLTTSIITILFARCASWVAGGEHKRVYAQLTKTINMLGLILIPGSFGIITLSEVIVTVFLKRGSFDLHSVLMTKDALCIYTAGLFFFALRDTLTKVFYAYKMTKVTTITSICTIFLNIVLNFIFIDWWGINGLALATCVAAVIQCIVLHLIFNLRIHPLDNAKLLKRLVTSVITSVMMSKVVWSVFEILNRTGMDQIVALLGAVVSGVCVYGCGILLFDRAWLVEVIEFFGKNGGAGDEKK